MHAIVIDTETSDKDDPSVIELAYAELSLAQHGVTYRTPVNQKFTPTKDVSFGALATHHILPIDYVGKPHFDPALHTPQAEYYIGHNIDFDWKAVGSPKGKRICTLALARKYISECDSHSQTALMYFITPEDERHIVRNHLRNAHSAVADIIFCVKILAEINKQIGATTFEQLWQASEEARIPQIMTFGKFKGEPVWEVDPSWRGWYRKQPDQDPYLLEAFRRYPYGKEPK